MSRPYRPYPSFRPSAFLRAFALAFPLVAFLSSTSAAEVPPAVKAMLAKSASFNLGKYPISFWSYTNLNEHADHMTEAEVAEWADCGFTVPMSPSFDPAKPEQVAHMHKLLDWAHVRGMKLILCDPRCGAHWADQGGKLVVPPGYADGVRAAVKQFGDHPALFGFLVGDEPDAAMKDAFFECARIQKEIAPHLHPFANLLPFFPGIESRAGTDTWPNYLDEFYRKGNADLYSYDCYVQMNPGQSGWNDYFQNLRLNREAALRNGIPFWNTDLCTGHYNYRCPNYYELRWQFNTTVAAGAHGIIWFFYYQRAPEANYRFAPIDENWNHTQTWDDLRHVQKTFSRLYGDLFTRLAATRVTFNPVAFGGGEKFTPDDLVARISPDTSPVMLTEFVDAQGRRYVMLVNLSMTDNTRVSITLTNPKARYFSWNWQGKEFEGPSYSSNGQSRDDHGLLVLDHFLSPAQEAVYRIE